MQAQLGDKWAIYWTEYGAESYLYGTEIIYHARDDIEINNRLMPPGTVIHEWYSKTNYQKHRIEPSLPIIDGEGKYRLTVDVECPQGQDILFRIVYYNRFDEEIGHLNIRDCESDFQCPIQTYSYRLQLINGGMEQMHFHKLTIQEILNNADNADDTEETE